jgi:D-amino peptidase
MKIAISADIEGATGYAGGTEGGFPANYAGPGETHPDYMRQRLLLTADINAAIEGAIEAGAETFVVHDTHGLDMRNVLIEELNPAASLVKGRPIIFFDHRDLDEGYDLAFYIGMHARSGEAAMRSHVLDWPRITEIRINGLPASESHITAALAGHFGIRSGLITGDDAICAEIRAWSGDTIETAVTKYSLSRYAARCVGVLESQDRIRKAARAAVEQADRMPVSGYDFPITMEVEFLDREVAYTCSWMPEVRYDGNRVVSYTNDSFLAIHEFLLAAFWIGASKLNP